MYDTNLFDANVQVDKANLKKDSLTSIEFQPSYRKSPDHVFTAIIRFVPYWKQVTESVVSKYTVWLENPLTHERREIDDPSTVNEPSIFTQTFFDLRNSPDPVLKENSKGWSRKMRYASIVQILDCPSDPSLVNQLKIWRYGEKIYALIADQLKPSNPMVAPVSPFSLFNGRYLYLKVQEKSGFNNFDACAFYDSTDDKTKVQCPIVGKDGSITYVPVNQKNVQNKNFEQAVSNWLKEGPSLEPYKYHPMSDDDRNFAITCANISKNPKATLQAASNQFGMGSGVNYGTQPAANPSGITNMNSGQPVNSAYHSFTPGQPPIPQPAQPQPAQPQMPSINEAPSLGEQLGTVPPAPQPPTGFSGNGLDNLDDVLGGLGNAPEPEPKQDSPEGGLGNLDEIIKGIL